MASVLLRGFAVGFVIAASPGPIFYLCLRRATMARTSTAPPIRASQRRSPTRAVVTAPIPKAARAA